MIPKEKVVKGVQIPLKSPSWYDMKATCLPCLASGKCGNLLSKENRTKNARDSKLKELLGSAWRALALWLA